MSMSGAQGEQKRVSDTLKLELRMIVSHRSGAGNQTLSSGRQLVLLAAELFLQAQDWNFKQRKAIDIIQMQRTGKAYRKHAEKLVRI